MQRFSMIATGEIDCIGLSAMPSDRLDVSAVQASVLLRKRLARFATDEDDIVPESIPKPEPEGELVIGQGFSVLSIDMPEVTPARKRRASKRGTYRRRDMQAEG
jgi:hypothetical protein